jgi:hypothetical protein
MEKRELQKNDVVQISPEGKYAGNFGGMLMVVTEPKSFGAQGYLLSPHEFPVIKYKGRAFLRVKFEDMEYVGKLTWEWCDKEEEDNEKS